MSDKSEWWQMPKKGTGNAKILEKEILDIDSPYEHKKPPFCYPGTTLKKKKLGRARNLLAKQINSIGCHTHFEKDKGKEDDFAFKEGEGGFEQVQQIEAKAIWRISSMVGGTPYTTDGYFCGGGTEANLEGMWVGRAYLRQFPDPMNKGIVILVTPLAHYSIMKASELLDIGHSQTIGCTKCGKNHIFVPDPTGSGVNMVGMNHKGEMSIKSLKNIFQRKYDEGFRRFMLVPTIGTCLMGSIDPVNKIGKFIRDMNKKTGANFYMHVDASFAGFTIPFIKPGMKIWFNVPEVMSITIDGDKMGRLPYPAGIFLCRKDLMRLIARKVNYVRGNNDDTVSGSRSCIAPIYFWYLSETEGILGQTKYVQECLNGRNKLIELIKEHQRNQTGFAWVKIHPYSPYVNFVPLEINIQGGEIPKSILEPVSTKELKKIYGEKIPKNIPEGKLADYHLRSDFFPEDPDDPNSCPKTI